MKLRGSEYIHGTLSDCEFTAPIISRAIPDGAVILHVIRTVSAGRCWHSRGSAAQSVERISICNLAPILKEHTCPGSRSDLQPGNDQEVGGSRRYSFLLFLCCIVVSTISPVVQSGPSEWKGS